MLHLLTQVSLVTLAAADLAGKAAATLPIAVFNVAAALTVSKLFSCMVVVPTTEDRDKIRIQLHVVDSC
jgi:hypothetical protein